MKVFPEGLPETFLSDHWRCRFVHTDASSVGAGQPTYPAIEAPQVIALLDHLQKAGFDFVQALNLYFFDGERGFSLGQGE